MKKIAFLATIAATVPGCKTDLEVNAPYQDNTIIYGLLNPRDSVHYVKVNKAFLGEGDAYVYAQVQDSNEYAPEQIQHVRVHRLNDQGQRVQTFDLEPTLIEDREPGIFYYPEQVVYRFVSDVVEVINPAGDSILLHLHKDDDYELDVVVKGKQVGGTTSIVNNFSWSSVLQANSEINFYSNQGYRNVTFTWNSSRDGKRYELRMRFNYTEVRGEELTPRYADFLLGTRVANNSQGFSEELSITFDGEQFYSGLASRIPADATVDRRIFTGIDLLMTVANDDLHTALTLSEPVSGIVEERPQYSNVQNGHGIFASRYTQSLIGRSMNGISTGELVNGPYTSHLGFCSIFSPPGTETACD